MPGESGWQVPHILDRQYANAALCASAQRVSAASQRQMKNA